MRMRVLAIAFAGACLLAPVTYVNAQYQYTTFGPPYTFGSFPGGEGSPNGGVFGINNSDEIVGTTSGNPFLYAGNTYTFFGGNGIYYATGINNSGQIVGYSVPSNQPGVLLSGGIYTAPPAGFIPDGINDFGQIVGSDNGSGCLLNSPLGTPTPVNPGNDTNITAINDAGAMIVSGSSGYYLLSGGNETAIDFPGSISTVANGINNSGQIVGTYYTPTEFPGYNTSDGFCSATASTPKLASPIRAFTVVKLQGLMTSGKSSEFTMTAARMQWRALSPLRWRRPSPRRS